MGNVEAFADLDEAKLNQIHLRITVLSALGEFLDGYDLLIIVGALLLIVPEFHLAAFQVGGLATAAYGGSVVGSLLSGWIADKLGRRGVMILDFVLFVVAAKRMPSARARIWVGKNSADHVYIDTAPITLVANTKGNR